MSTAEAFILGFACCLLVYACSHADFYHRNLANRQTEKKASNLRLASILLPLQCIDDLANAACGALLRAGSYRPMRINPEVVARIANMAPMPGSPNYGRRGPDPGRQIW